MTDKTAAQLTALTMLVEYLLVEDLAQDPRPRVIADEIIGHRHRDERELSEKHGSDQQRMLVTERLTQILDRAVARAESLRASGRRP